jgi:branched-chain amino acid transport system substrate-binding protein
MEPETNRVSAEGRNETAREAGALTRRDFLKIAGVGGAALGLGAGLGGVLAACGGGTTSSSATTAPAPAGSTTSVSAVATTASAGAQSGRDIKMGVVAPVTGPLAAFAVPGSYSLERWKQAVADGVVLGDKQTHKFQFVMQDSQSDTNRAAQVAGDLIMNNKIDMMLVASSPDNVNPVADQCETNGVPCVSCFCPWEPFYFGRGATPDKPFKWTYLSCTGAQDIMVVYADMWQNLPTNKKVGLLLANDADGNAWADEKTGLPPVLKAKGYEYVLPTLFQSGSEDFTKQISQYKQAGCEIMAGSLAPPDFTNFWKQSIQQSFHPKILTIGKALLFPQAVQAVGPIAYNATTELAWHPKWPFKSSFTGETCQQLADDFEAKSGNEWTAPLSQYQLFEWAVDVLKRTANPDDKAAIAESIKSTKLDTIAGPIDMTVPVDMAGRHPVLNVYKPVMGGGQWVKGTKYPFEIVQISNVTDPQIPVSAKIQPMQYS